MSDAPERIWTEEDEGCPYYYPKSELHLAQSPVIEYVRADRIKTLEVRQAELVEALEAAQESIATFIGVHGYPMDSGAGEVLRQVDAALAKLEPR